MPDSPVYNPDYSPLIPLQRQFTASKNSNFMRQATAEYMAGYCAFWNVLATVGDTGDKGGQDK